MAVGLELSLGFSYPGRKLSLELEAEAGSITALVGPSGSGKTTLLRLLAGLLRPDSGHIRVNGATWFDATRGVNLPPQSRRIGMVFQDYALFPHLTALDNVAYARRDREAMSVARRHAVKWLGRVHMQGLEERRPHQLSGGQRQRVAVARALAREPELLLLDEPFSAVDQVVRRKLREELLELTASLECPVVMVTHDLQEATMLGSRLGVMHRGAMLQSGPRDEVFFRPASELVARLVDMRNLLPVEVENCTEGLATVRWSGRSLEARSDRSYPPGMAVWAGIRPEHLLVLREGSPAGPNEVAGKVERLHHLGAQVQVQIRPDGMDEEGMVLEFSEHLLERFGIREGGEIRVNLWPERLHLISRDAKG